MNIDLVMEINLSIVLTDQLPQPTLYYVLCITYIVLKSEQVS